MMLTTEPYVPAIIRNVPDSTTNTLQQTIRTHRGFFVALPCVQLSYSHMQPMGWKDIMVPSRAPINETRSLKTGIALAMMYATIVMPRVQPSQVAQCVTVLAVRWREPCRARTKMYLAGNWADVSLPLHAGR